MDGANRCKAWREGIIGYEEEVYLAVVMVVRADDMKPRWTGSWVLYGEVGGIGQTAAKLETPGGGTTRIKPRGRGRYFGLEQG